MSRPKNDKNGTVIVVANGKGGVGKTTVAINLAIGLSKLLLRDGENKGNVLVVDLDPQGNIAHYLGIDAVVGRRCVSNVLLGRPADERREYSPAEILAQNMIPMKPLGEPHNRYPNLVVLPATESLKYATAKLIEGESTVSGDWRRQTADRVSIHDSINEKIVKYARQIFRYVILDCAPNMGVLTPAVYRAGDYVFVPTRPDYLSSRGTVQHTEELDMLINHHDERIRGRARLSAIIPTMADTRQNLTAAAVDRLKQNYPGLVTIPIPESTRVREASAAHLSVPEYEPGTPLAASFLSLVQRAARL